MFESVKRMSLLNSKDITVNRVLAALKRRILSVPDKITYKLPWGFPNKNYQNIKQYHNIHKGKRCFIVANGPSLNKIDFSLLRDEITIGMNRIYLMKEQNGFEPNYLACIDEERLVKPFKEDLDSLTMPCFFLFSHRKFFSQKENQCFLNGCFSPKFYKDCSKGVGSGKTVTYTVIQLAFYMGFSEVYIIGKDHSFNQSGKAGVGVEVKGDDENHFIKNYFKVGQKWDLPDFETEEYAYRLSRIAFESDGRKIMNATIGGKLDIFERVDYYSLFPQQKEK